ncbi:MAG: aspartate--tRNA ligase [Longimicrobiales bacterium]|nr:aspartate--tRNA ligase [Longimicrobiales bacterium]
MTEPRSTTYRTSVVGVLRGSDTGKRVRLVGWVHRRRDLGGLLFVDLRDRSGLAQISFGPDWTPAETLALAGSLGAEDVIGVEGEVVARPDPNPEMATGAVEVRATTIERLSKARTPEIPVYRGPDEELPSEELRLRHRALDLRRPELQCILELRHRLVLATRNFLSGEGFLEVETPILTKPTPEGARDYLVPSRVHPGEFYALPQSPQIYKQLLMVSGFDRYFQIARCFRDEDLRADRQPEFTQIDLEASFVGVDDIRGWMDGLMNVLTREAGLPDAAPMQQMTWDEAMDRFGTDRPDLRWSLELADWTDELGGLDFGIVQAALRDGGRIRGLHLTGGAALSRRQIEEIESAAKRTGAPGLLWAKRNDEGGSGPLARFMQDEDFDRIGLLPGDLALVAAGDDRRTGPALDATRMAAIRALDLPKEREHAWLWVSDFPLFNEEEGALGPNHHPFVLPHADALASLEDDPLTARGHAYDLVYNGSEFGSGSLRIHDPDLQRRIFRVLGLDDDEIERKFGFLLHALGAGAPPHGGIALGVDRIVQRFAGVSSLRDVMAFPKTTAARALMEGAPTSIGAKDLEALHLSIPT